ncbi:hypothetical protein R3P38DRAFT_2778552 [Favolaschia claudopus]|uniref:Uncharacterized protein n=1 Tax=Favolaschia claudopus TaxID=2862362 RepID=A0AAW0BHI0_9AGAR
MIKYPSLGRQSFSVLLWSYLRCFWRLGPVSCMPFFQSLIALSRDGFTVYLRVEWTNLTTQGGTSDVKEFDEQQLARIMSSFRPPSIHPPTPTFLSGAPLLPPFCATLALVPVSPSPAIIPSVFPSALSLLSLLPDYLRADLNFAPPSRRGPMSDGIQMPLFPVPSNSISQNEDNLSSPSLTHLPARGSVIGYAMDHRWRATRRYISTCDSSTHAAPVVEQPPELDIRVTSRTQQLSTVQLTFTRRSDHCTYVDD